MRIIIVGGRRRIMEPGGTAFNDVNYRGISDGPSNNDNPLCPDPDWGSVDPKNKIMWQQFFQLAYLGCFL